MGGAISTAISLGFTYCCCNVAGGLCNSCLGTTAAGTTGRKRSVLLLSIAIAFSLWFQHWVGPNIVTKQGWMWKTYRAIPGVGNIVYNSWYNSCKYYDKAGAEETLEQCAGNSGVLRPMFVSTIFFLLQALATKAQPSLNKQAWPAKFGVFLIAVLITVFLNSSPLFTGVYLWIARFGAAIFLVLQQVILIDVAYNWNDDWVERSNEADRVEFGSGQGWLQAILATCVTFYASTITGIALMYTYFGDCAGNNWIISLSLVGVLAMTVVQMSGTEGSLLTSSVMSLYSTYLALTIISKNPDPVCNPFLTTGGSNRVWELVVGLFLTAVSLAWTGWSWTAEERLSSIQSVQEAKPVHSQTSSKPDNVNLDVPFLDPEDRPASGIVMESAGADDTSVNSTGAEVWKLNIVMALVSCYVAMFLTGWGTLEEFKNQGGTMIAANPTIGRVNMAMIGISQWLAMLLYIWTLAAPRLFPDRDFN